MRREQAKGVGCHEPGHSCDTQFDHGHGNIKSVLVQVLGACKPMKAEAGFESSTHGIMQVDYAVHCVSKPCVLSVCGD